MVSWLLHVRPCLLISLDLEFLALWSWSSCAAKLTSPIRSRKRIAPQAKNGWSKKAVSSVTQNSQK